MPSVAAMLASDIDLIRDVLPKGRTPWSHVTGSHPLRLLAWLLEAGWTMRALRGSTFARLLDHPEVMAIRARRGRLEMDATDLDPSGHPSALFWGLELAEWDGEDRRSDAQVSRRGSNLVLLLNFPAEHGADCAALEDFLSYRAFVASHHPHSRRDMTLAWARLDVDLAAGDVLIEEIQCDWVRLARACLRHSPGHEGLHRYVTTVLPRYADGWPETMLTAALSFCVEELGIRRIWMHDHGTGNRLKRIGQGSARTPPRSLYTDLPRRFCFTRVAEVPGLLAGEARRIRGVKARRQIGGPAGFWMLDFTPPAPQHRAVTSRP